MTLLSYAFDPTENDMYKQARVNGGSNYDSVKVPDNSGPEKHLKTSAGGRRQ